MCLQLIYIIYMYKLDLTFDNLQLLIRHKTKQNQIPLTLSSSISINHNNLISSLDGIQCLHRAY